MKQLLNKFYIRYIGVAGIVCLLLSGIIWGIRMSFGTIPAVLSIVGLICLLAYLVVDFKNIRTQFSKRSVKYGTNVTFMILIVLGIIIMVEAISSRHSFQLDLTKHKRFTLSEQTKKILNALDRDVNVLAFFSLDLENRQVLEDLLKQYSHISPQIKYEFVDPIKNPGRARSYEITVDGTVVLETAEKQEKVFEISEESLTNALVKVSREGKKVIYFLKGHGERDLENIEGNGYNLAKKAIENENYEIKDLVLMQQQSVPEDASVLIVGGLQKDLLSDELNVLKAYIQQGGNLLFLIDPDQGQGMMPFLKEYGIILGDDMVFDPSVRLLSAGLEIPVVLHYQEHPITEKFFNVYTCFPIARSVTVDQTLPEGVTAQPLASTSPEGWAETNKEELQHGKVEPNKDSDLLGPVSLAAVATVDATPEQSEEENSVEDEIAQKKTKARLVVFGDSDFVSNAYIGFYGNGDLFLNTVSWLAEEEDLVAIRAKNPEVSPFMLNATQGRLVFLLSMILLPLGVLITGIMIYVNRRKATR